MDSDLQPPILILPSDLRFLSVARGFVESVCRAAGIERPITDAVVLAINEAISNIIRHAHRDKPAASLRVECRMHPDNIEILLTDEGHPFNLDAVPCLDPAEIRVGGRGIFLMRSLMDELSCKHRPEGGNVLRLVKRLPPRGSTP